MNWHKYRPQEFKWRGRWIDNWFSNMVEDPITIDGLTYPSVENYYQAMKSTDPKVWKHFTTISPSQSKAQGRKLEIRSDWENVKRAYMFNGLRHKFLKKEWREKLLETGEEKIIEWNNWNDKLWGVSIVDNEGENMLGDILMNMREAYKLILDDEEYTDKEIL